MDGEDIGTVGTRGQQIAVATAAQPVNVEGNAVALSTDLAGVLRVVAG